MARCIAPDGSIFFSRPGYPCPGNEVSEAQRQANLERAREQLSVIGFGPVQVAVASGLPTEFLFGFPDSSGVLSPGRLALASGIPNAPAVTSDRPPRSAAAKRAARKLLLILILAAIRRAG